MLIRLHFFLGGSKSISEWKYHHADYKRNRQNDHGNLDYAFYHTNQESGNVICEARELRAGGGGANMYDRPGLLNVSVRISQGYSDIEGSRAIECVDQSLALIRSSITKIVVYNVRTSTTDDN